VKVDARVCRVTHHVSSNEAVMTTRRALTAALLVLTGAIPIAAAQGGATGTLDRRVEAVLKQARLAYSIDDGDFRLVYQSGDGRSQRVWVASGTTRLDPLEIRDVWSVAARGRGEPPPELAQRLLQENARMTLGAWQVNRRQGEYLVVFSAPVDAAADAAALQAVIEVVMRTADRIEMEFNGRDEF
jgi:hypothetical protein